MGHIPPDVAGLLVVALSAIFADPITAKLHGGGRQDAD